jgi:hypothetical protein
MSEPSAIEICGWKECAKAATHSYRWDWGEEGKCCADCIVLLQQTAANLSRTVATRPLDSAAAVTPLSRNERTQLIAAKLSAEAELEEVQQRGSSLYQANVDLTSQVQTHVMRAREHASIVAEKDGQIERLSKDLERRERELGEATAELQRLRVLAQFAPTKGKHAKEETPKG